MSVVWSGWPAPLRRTRGGTMTYGRYANSLFLDPVLNDANVDIWILTNLYDTLLRRLRTATGWSRASPPNTRCPTTGVE